MTCKYSTDSLLKLASSANLGHSIHLTCTAAVLLVSTGLGVVPAEAQVLNRVTETFKITGGMTRSPINVDDRPDSIPDEPTVSADEDQFTEARANVLLQGGEYEQIASRCTELLNQQEAGAWPRFYRACAYFHQNEFRLAVRDFKLTAADPFYGRTSHIWLGACFERLKKYQSSIAHYTEAINAGDTDPGLFVSRGCVVGLTGKWQDALDDFNHALELQPRNGWALNNRGYAHAKLNNLDDALHDLNSAIELEPASANTYNYRGYVHEQLKDLDSAIIDLSRAIELNSEYAAAFMNRGYAYLLKNECEKAEKDFRRARELDSHLRDRRPVL